MISVSSLLELCRTAGLQVGGVADDSRQVRPGDLFLAYPGDLSDGRRFIADAVKRGAVAVFWQPGEGFAWDPELKIANWPVAKLRALAGPLAHAVYGFPSERLSLIAVTGTNGKTTVSQCIARAHPQRCAVVGTLGAGFPESLVDTGFTTPEATALMRQIGEFSEAGALACALEASSIGIEEGRMNGLRVDVAIFTNFTRDHLDYHGSLEAYRAAKEKLFKWPRLRLAVINLDDPLGKRLAREAEAMKILGYTLSDGRQDVPGVIRAEKIEASERGQRFNLVMPSGRAVVDTALVGRYNISNLLAVAAVLMDAGLRPDEVASRLGALSAPPGRMERLGGVGEPLVMVDYSHTPDALENALATLRPVAAGRHGRLWVVFGCGGDRDAGKRPLMGEIASRLADRVILTNDNPRSEAPAVILAAIAQGAPAAVIEADRAKAIRQAVLGADAADVVLLAGKGHENYQEAAGIRVPFSDLEQATLALSMRNTTREDAA